jgi:hypothetical protein
MVWSYGLSSQVLVNHAKTSECTEVVTLPAGTGTLRDGTYDDSESSISSTKLDYDYASTVSTYSSAHASTIHVHYLSNLHVSSNITLLTFSARSHVTTSIQINRHHTSSLSFQLLHNRSFQVYGFDLNENWQGDREHYDNQKVNGLTFPRVIFSLHSKAWH